MARGIGGGSWNLDGFSGSGSVEGRGRWDWGVWCWGEFV